MNASEKPTERDLRNFRALVLWHEDDLRKLMNGVSAMDIFTSDKRKNLKKYGVLFRPRQGKVKPTSEAIAILNSPHREDETN